MSDFLLEIGTEEIIVTARKREESIMKAPVIMQAISQQKIADLKITDFRELGATTPGLQVANAFHNQLELPMLFYAVVAFILITSTNSLVFVLLAWIFVLSRLVHAYIHTGANDVLSRSMAIGVGALALVAMWVIFAIRILVTGA